MSAAQDNLAKNNNNVIVTKRFMTIINSIMRPEIEWPSQYTKTFGEEVSNKNYFPSDAISRFNFRINEIKNLLETKKDEIPTMAKIALLILSYGGKSKDSKEREFNINRSLQEINTELHRLHCLTEFMSLDQDLQKELCVALGKQREELITEIQNLERRRKDKVEQINLEVKSKYHTVLQLKSRRLTIRSTNTISLEKTVYTVYDHGKRISVLTESTDKDTRTSRLMHANPVLLDQTDNLTAYDVLTRDIDFGANTYEVFEPWNESTWRQLTSLVEYHYLLMQFLKLRSTMEIESAQIAREVVSNELRDN